MVTLVYEILLYVVNGFSELGSKVFISKRIFSFLDEIS
jgi:hypothetical protein